MAMLVWPRLIQVGSEDAAPRPSFPRKRESIVERLDRQHGFPLARE